MWIEIYEITHILLVGIACSKRSDSGERCEEKKAMERRGGLGEVVPIKTDPLLFLLPGYEMYEEDGIVAIQKQLTTLPKPNYILLGYLWYAALTFFKFWLDFWRLCRIFSSRDRIRTGHGKPWKSWKLRILFSRPGKSWNLIVGPWKSWKIKFLFGSLVTADDKAWTM